MPNILTEIRNKIGIVTVNRPEQMNCMNAETRKELVQTFEKLEKNNDISVCILTGTKSKAFIAGADIKEFSIMKLKNRKELEDDWRITSVLSEMSKPIIAMIDGFCLGGGVGLAGASDIVIASDDAYFGLPEVDRGALGAASHLARMFPLQHVRRMMFTAEPITASEAYRLGALEEVVSKEELLSSAIKLATKIAEKSPLAIRLAKESLNGIEPNDVDKSYLYEQGFTLKLYESEDSTEARKAFVEKREADFKD